MNTIGGPLSPQLNTRTKVLPNVKGKVFHSFGSTVDRAAGASFSPKHLVKNVQLRQLDGASEMLISTLSKSWWWRRLIKLAILHDHQQFCPILKDGNVVHGITIDQQ